MIELRELTIHAGDCQLQRLSLTVAASEYAVLMGRTGMGKTTLLESICGLRKSVSGQILIQGIDVTDWPPGDRAIGYVPQDLALFPTMLVAEHLAFALRLRRWTKHEINSRVDELASVLGLTDLLKRGITYLSGGERQRVALGRALAFRPVVLLLDEPLSALDERTRDEMHALLRDVKEKTGVTTLHVTHNSDEAAALADSRYELSEGALIRKSA